MQILLVDDDRELVDLLAFALRRAGLDPLPAYDATSALEVFADKGPDLAVLDINLGLGNGLDVLKALRQRSQLPVIMLTAFDTEEDKVRGLELGADDYMTKPFSHRELIARIRAHLRRAGLVTNEDKPAPPSRLEVGPFVLDRSTHSFTKHGRAISLTVTEFRVMDLLMQLAGTVVPTATLMKQVWGGDLGGGNDVLRVTVHRLRRKIEDDPSQPMYLHTIAGVGVLLRG